MRLTRPIASALMTLVTAAAPIVFATASAHAATIAPQSPATQDRGNYVTSDHPTSSSPRGNYLTGNYAVPRDEPPPQDPPHLAGNYAIGNYLTGNYAVPGDEEPPPDPR
jgi:hypothetical protein